LLIFAQASAKTFEGKMKILQLTKKFPYPQKDGEAIAISNLSKALRDLGCEMTLLSMNTKKHFFDINMLPADFDQYKTIHCVDVDSELKIKDAFFNLFSEESYHIQRFVSKDFDEKLKDVLSASDFDVVQLETLYLAPYIPTIRKYSNALVAMRAHNVEHEIWERITQNTALLPKKWYLSHLTEKLKDYEVRQLDNFDILVPVTERDEQRFRQLGFKNGATATPIGVDYKDHQPDYSVFKKPLSISFIGSLDWMPNQEGLTWFLENVWDKATQKYPSLTLHIAGRNCPDWIRALEGEHIKIYGEVPCAATFVNQHPLTIVPLLSGSGMRAKILEGMALGKVVISTSVGLEGIDARDKKEVLLADTPEAILEALDFCFQHPQNLPLIGAAAHRFVYDRYNNLQIARRLVDTYKAYARTSKVTQ
jgi:glycosyltransferase involved in cell wall biosynthesis